MKPPKKRQKRSSSKICTFDDLPWSTVNVEDSVLWSGTAGNDASIGGMLAIEEYDGPLPAEWMQTSEIPEVIEGDDGNAAQNVPTEPTDTPSEKKRKRKGKRKTKTAATSSSAIVLKAQESVQGGTAEFDVSAWREFELDERLLRAIQDMRFTKPTPIQALCLPAATRDWHDIVGAAETGSGKTLAFGLPILQRLLKSNEQGQEAAMEELGPSGLPKKSGQHMAALILTPTRELALQIAQELSTAAKYTHTRAAAIVGGMSMQKQKRILQSRPAIIVGTPGRLWDLMVSGEKHLTDMSSLQFLVMDEADRMLEHAHFKEISNMLRVLPPPHVMKNKNVEEEDTVTKMHRNRTGGRGIEERQIGEKKSSQDALDDDNGDVMDSDGEEPTHVDRDMEEDQGPEEDEAQEMEDVKEEEQEVEQAQKAPQIRPKSKRAGYGELTEDDKQVFGGLKQLQATCKRQTFLFSATLTLPRRYRPKPKSDKKPAAKQQHAKDKEDDAAQKALDDLLDKIEFRTTPKVIDLTTARRVVSTLHESKIECLTTEKDLYVYYIGLCYGGRTIVFVNAVTGVRRLVNLLTLVGLQAFPLHAKLQQRQRLKYLDRFRSSENALLIATDVAARGLDIPAVTNIIHYQLPHMPETYIHRSGRTARASASGVSIALVSAEDFRKYTALCKFLNRAAKGLDDFEMDRAMLPKLKERLSVARRLEVALNAKKKESVQSSWMEKTAEQLEINLDRDRDEEEQLRKSKRKDSEMAQLRAQLDSLLKQTLVPRGVSLRYSIGQGMHVKRGTFSIPT